MGATLLEAPSSAQIRSSLSLASDQKNQVMVTEGGLLEYARIMWGLFFNKPAETRPSENVPVQSLTRTQLITAPNNTVYRLGHSTVLMKLNDGFWITDPVFSQRASPVQFVGPERFHASPIDIDELPAIKSVIISHDHYDHLDYASIMMLAGKVDFFLTPLGVGNLLIEWGVPTTKVRQLDCWQGIDVGDVHLVATPSQHFSGRGLFNKNLTQWVSWVILAPEQRVFFSGDSGYFDGFKEIGDKYGPFDLTLLESGAYNENWPMVHMHPPETIQSHLDLKGKRLLPIHNSTFDLSMHPWSEPLDQIVDLGGARGIAVLTPGIGEPVWMNDYQSGRRWWEAVDRNKHIDEQVRHKGHSGDVHF